MNRSRSIVEYFGLGDGHRCGYCGNADTNVSHGIDRLVMFSVMYLWLRQFGKRSRFVSD